MDEYIVFEIQFKTGLTADFLNEVQESISAANNDEEINDMIDGDVSFLFPSISKCETHENKLSGEVMVSSVLYQEDIDDFMFVFEHWLDLLAVIRKLPNVVNCSVRFGADEFLWDGEKYNFPQRHAL